MATQWKQARDVLVGERVLTTKGFQEVLRSEALITGNWIIQFVGLGLIIFHPNAPVSVER